MGIGIKDFDPESEFAFRATKDYESDDLFPEKDINFKTGDIIRVVNKDGKFYYEGEKWSSQMTLHFGGSYLFSPRFMGFMRNHYFDVI